MYLLIRNDDKYGIMFLASILPSDVIKETPSIHEAYKFETKEAVRQMQLIYSIYTIYLFA
jgi:hypothetical protein